MQYTAEYHSPFGLLTLASDGTALTGLWFAGQKYFGASLGTHQPAELPIFSAVSHWLDRYFAGEAPEVTIPLAPQGSAFRQAVWQQLLQIPYGQTSTYGTIANALAQQTGKPVSAQAVGGAVGHNPISILIPCHRVLGADGSLTGYAAGIEIKKQLLLLEQTIL